MESDGRRMSGWTATCSSVAVACVLLLSGCSFFSDGADSKATVKNGSAADTHLGIEISHVTGAEGAHITFTAATAPPASRSLPFADLVGDVVAVTPDRPIAAADISLAFQPDKDLPAAAPGQLRAAVANAFIAIFDEPSGMWLPLETTYDGAGHRLHATAPHFSRFGRYVVKPFNTVVRNPLASVANTIVDGADRIAHDTVDLVNTVTTTGVEAFKNYIWQPLDDYGRHLFDDATGAFEAEHLADCGNGTSAAGTPLPEDRAAHSTTVPSPLWAATVVSHTRFLAACAVADPKNSAKSWLRVENRRAYPVDLLPPHGALAGGWNPYDSSMLDELVPMLNRLTQSVVSQGLAGALRSAELGIPANAYPMTINVRADWLAIAWDMILAAIAFVPDAVELEATLVTVIRAEISDGEVTDGTRSVTEIIAVLRQKVQVKVSNGKAKEADGILDAYECAMRQLQAGDEPNATKLLDTVRNCLGVALKAISNTFAELAISAFGNLTAPDEFVQFVVHGNNTDTITLTRVEPVYMAADGALASQAVIAPKDVGISADSSFFLSNMTWQWSSTEATGTGTATVNTCTPDCAAGHDISFPVTVRLSDPRHLCGKEFFTMMITTPDKSVPKSVMSGPSTNDITPYGCQ